MMEFCAVLSIPTNPSKDAKNGRMDWVCFGTHLVLQTRGFQAVLISLGCSLPPPRPHILPRVREDFISQHY